MNTFETHTQNYLNNRKKRDTQEAELGNISFFDKQIDWTVFGVTTIIVVLGLIILAAIYG